MGALSPQPQRLQGGSPTEAKDCPRSRNGSQTFLATVAQGIGVVWVDGPKGEFPGTEADDFVVPLSVPAPYFAGNRDVVERVIRAYIGASELVKSNPQAAARAIRHRFASLDDGLFKLVWDGNVAAWKNIVPSTAALRRTQNQAAGNFATQIKALDPDSMLLADTVKKVQASMR